MTLSFEAHEGGGEVLHPYLVIRGRATIEMALDVMDQLAEFYIGPSRFRCATSRPDFQTVRVEVDKVYGVVSRNAGDGSGRPDEA